jgi:hypothetical protein
MALVSAHDNVPDGGLRAEELEPGSLKGSGTERIIR